MAPFAILENRLASPDEMASFYCHQPTAEFRCDTQDTIVTTLNAIDKARQSGAFLVGHISYEAVYALDPSVLDEPIISETPLIHFYTFAKHENITQSQVQAILQQHQSATAPLIFDINLGIDEETYHDKIAAIKQHLQDGDTYQVNLTDHYHFKYQGNAADLYAKLRNRQRTAYSALLQFPDRQIVSLSPELFFTKQGAHLCNKPMKGTMPVAGHAQQDAQAIDHLLTDPKLLAENVIVVDLMRNDLSRIAKPGSVKVPQLFAVESYETVHQMISEIIAEVEPDYSFSNIINALFPCGSITGAPKKRTLQIIRDQEQHNRGVYTGAIGYITPDNDMCFNVAIRTLELNNGEGRLGVGGGIVYDSDPHDEFMEMQLKGNFFTNMPADFALIECLRFHSEEDYPLLQAHIKRLSDSAKLFNFQCPTSAIEQSLQRKARELDTEQVYKVKITLQKNGHYNITYQVASTPNEPVLIGIHSQPVIDSQNVLFQHKTTAPQVRQRYNTLLAQAKQNGWFDAIVTNEHGQICEGCITNIIIQKNGTCYTPAIKCGLLPGIMRDHLIDNHMITETILSIEDLHSADKIWLCNAVIGKIEARLAL